VQTHCERALLDYKTMQPTTKEIQFINDLTMQNMSTTRDVSQSLITGLKKDPEEGCANESYNAENNVRDD
jgi:hypothetical protein